MAILIGHAVNNSPDIRSNKRTRKLIDNDTYVGLEVELEGVKFNSEEVSAWCPLLQLVHDDSLRGDSGEIIFSVPLRGNDVSVAVKAIESLLLKKKMRPILSERLSVHVHLDMRDMEVDMLKRFLATYLSVERVLYHYCGHNRENNIFCVPMYKSSDTIDNIAILLETKTTGEFYNVLANYFGDSRRYGGLNLAALLAHGSIEFRMMRGLWRKQDILNWINIILSIKKYAIKVAEGSISYPSHVYAENSLSFLNDVFGKYSQDLMYQGVETDIVKGARNTQDLCLSCTHKDISWDVIALSNKSNLCLPRKEEDDAEEKTPTSSTNSIQFTNNPWSTLVQPVGAPDMPTFKAFINAVNADIDPPIDEF